jgi:hypothetical protein
MVELSNRIKKENNLVDILFQGRNEEINERGGIWVLSIKRERSILVNYDIEHILYFQNCDNAALVLKHLARIWFHAYTPTLTFRKVDRHEKTRCLLEDDSDKLRENFILLLFSLLQNI